MAWKPKPSLCSTNKPSQYMCTMQRINYCCWKPCGGKIVIMNVCFVSWGNRHNEILLPLLDLTVVRLYSLFLWDPPTMESNLLDRITFDVSDCCDACHPVSSVTSLSSLSCLLNTYLRDVSLPDTFHSLSVQTGELVIVLPYFVLALSANYFGLYSSILEV